MRRRKRRRRGIPAASELSIPEILGWADAHRRRTGQWPIHESGPIHDGPLGTSWAIVDQDLRRGFRGLPGGSSLARLLAERRNVRNIKQLPPLDRAKILAWADAHHERTGSWPIGKSGRIADAPGETWQGVHAALHMGCRGLPGGSSLARLLAEERGVRNIKQVPRLTVARILAWADAHHRHTGAWPGRNSLEVLDAPGETWHGVDNALRLGQRGLPGRSSLARLLALKRGVRNSGQLPRLTVARILTWADAHYRRTGAWPKVASGPIVDAPGETWGGIGAAL